MKTINYVCTDRFGEFDLFFDEKGACLGAWCCNDAMYRPEYMNGLFRRLGFNVNSVSDRGRWKKLVDKEMLESFGLEPGD